VTATSAGRPLGVWPAAVPANSRPCPKSRCVQHLTAGAARSARVDLRLNKLGSCTVMDRNTIPTAAEREVVRRWLSYIAMSLAADDGVA
jgi:hypothetical protein